MKRFLKAEVEFIKFNTEDVITTSGDGNPFVDRKNKMDKANDTEWTQPTFNFVQ